MGNFSLKDQLFNPQKVTQLAEEIAFVYPSFMKQAFIEEVIGSFPRLELKERIYHMRDGLKKYLPLEYKEALMIILKALPPELDPKKSDDDFGDFIYAPYGEFVATYGCEQEYLELSFFALAEITKRFSMEYAIRDFINTFPTETLAMLYKLSTSPNYHQRRLASEGLRPKLPWAKKINIDYRKPLEHLDNLFYDPTRYVTRSVANHLNDIAKIDAPLVIETLKRWKKSEKQHRKEMEFIVNHALRTLVKKGDSEALAFLGYTQNPPIVVKDFKLINEKIMVGEELMFNLNIQAREETQVMVDYIIHFRIKNGKYSPKVYKLKQFILKKGESIKLSKKHLFRANMSTRKLYEGEHQVSLQINGKIIEEHTFYLKV